MPNRGQFEQLPYSTALSICIAFSAACSVEHSNLITSNPGSGGSSSTGGAGGAEGGAGGVGGAGLAGAGAAAGADARVVAVVDERPIGGASLHGGTTGGGTYAAASSAGRLLVVDTVDALRAAVSGDEPTVVLLSEGSYAFSATATDVSVCTQACTPSTPLASQTVPAGSCDDGATLFSVKDTHETLRIGKNKTLIGLGKGATLSNVSLSLSGSSNIILRNLFVVDLLQDVKGTGDAVLVWPGDHIWIDHCTFRNIGRAYLNIVSSYTDDGSQTVTAESGYMTLTHNEFDGKVDGACGQRSSFVVGTSRNPGLTFAHNWFHGARARTSYLFGPGSWAHFFNNYYSDIDGSGASVACGASALLQGNVFESSIGALYNGDEGAPTWKFCATGKYGQQYAPMGGTSDQDNLVDAASSLNLHGQPTDGAALVRPIALGSHRYTISAPASLTASAATYEVTLAAATNTVAADVKASAGAGRLF
ncbi:MAG: hypothetical protein QM756_17480 [Polyangiaceae bacterium]